MRPAQKSNRSRGRGNRKGSGGGNNMNRVFDSAGPEGKVRGTPQQIIDKYISLARDAQTSGDRVSAENFLQHAEHYQRILSAAMTAQEQTRRENAPAQDAAQTDEAGQPVDNEAPDFDTQPGGEVTPAQPVAAPETAQREAPSQARPAQPAADIGGMAMIDANPAEDSLLVDSEQFGEGRERGNGGRRRQPRKKPAPAPAAAEETPPPPADPAPTVAEG